MVIEGLFEVVVLQIGADALAHAAVVGSLQRLGARRSARRASGHRGSTAPAGVVGGAD